VRRPIRKRDLLRRIEALEARLAQPTPAPLDGQQAINVGTIAHHTYEGPGACRADLFGQACGAHRDEHQHVEGPR
jgi:hypothetical protein